MRGVSLPARMLSLRGSEPHAHFEIPQNSIAQIPMPMIAPDRIPRAAPSASLPRAGSAWASLRGRRSGRALAAFTSSNAVPCPNCSPPVSRPFAPHGVDTACSIPSHDGLVVAMIARPARPLICQYCQVLIGGPAAAVASLAGRDCNRPSRIRVHRRVLGAVAGKLASNYPLARHSHNIDPRGHGA